MKKNQMFIAIFLGITLIGLFFRIAWFSSVPATLYIDEMAMLADAKSVASTGRDMLGNHWWQVIYPSYGDYKQPVYIWLAVPFVWAFQGAQHAIRIPSLLAGLGTMIISPLIAMELWRWRNPKKSLYKKNLTWYKEQKWLGLAVYSVIATSPWAITFSRTGFEGHIAQFFLAAAIYLLLISVSKKAWLILSVLAMAVSTYAYFSVRFVAPIVFSTVATLLICMQRKIGAEKKISWFVKQALLFVVVPLFAFMLLLQPMFNSPLYEIANQFRMGTDSVLNTDDHIFQQNVARQIAGNTKLDRVLFHRDYYLFKALASNYSDFFRFDYVFLNGDQNLRHGTGLYGLYLLPTIIFLLAACYELFLKQKQIGLALIIWWLIAVLPAAVPETTPHALRSLNALVPTSIILGIGCYLVGKYIVDHWLQKGIQLISLVWIGWATWSLLSFGYYYFTVYPKLSQPFWAEKEQALVAKAMEYKSDPDEVYFSHVNSEIYLWVLGQKSFHSFPLKNPVISDYKIKSFDQFHFNETMPESLGEDRVVIVLRSDDWNEYVTAVEPQIWQQYEYNQPDQTSYTVALISQKQTNR